MSQPLAGPEGVEIGVVTVRKPSLPEAKQGPSLQDPRHRLEAGLPGGEIGTEGRGDFVVPLRTRT